MTLTNLPTFPLFYPLQHLVSQRFASCKSMGNRMSRPIGGGYRQLDHHDNASAQLDHGGHAPQPHNPNVARLRGGDASYDPSGRMGGDGRSLQGTKGESHGRLTPATPDAAVGDVYGVPPADFYAAQGSRRYRHQQSAVPAPRAIKNREAFDFNDARQANPWHSSKPQQRRAPEPQCIVTPALEPNVEIEVTPHHGLQHRH